MIVSRTIIASGISAIMAILQLFGISYEVSIADQDILVNALVIIASAAAAIYFRFTAKTNLQTGAPLVPPAAKTADEIKPIIIKD